MDDRAGDRTPVPRCRDDIDNAGVTRSKEERQDSRTIRKKVLSKKGWTNCRPLAAFCPDGLLYVNLSRADYTALDRRMPLAVLAKHRSTTVERLIRETSREHGIWSLTGPDQAITAVPMRTGRPGCVTSSPSTRHPSCAPWPAPRTMSRHCVGSAISCRNPNQREACWTTSSNACAGA
ncbi:hypothetical protein [Streptomyces sp. NPDC092903]|uniref:hypothetical protein n=1 Tax=Streptomyces sp. NPDC092903 TaxID=3366017 RepID=UPI003829792C